MLATTRQIAYLQHLTDRAEFIKMRHPSLIPLGLTHTIWDNHLTSEQAGLRIQMYRSILDNCYSIMYGRKRAEETEDLPA